MAQPFQQRCRCHAAGSIRLLAPDWQPEPRLPPATQPSVPFHAIVGDLAEAQISFCELRERSCLFPWFCFLSRLPWDTCRSLMGHRGARQEPAVDLVRIAPAWSPLAADDTGLDEI